MASNQDNSSGQANNSSLDPPSGSGANAASSSLDFGAASAAASAAVFGATAAATAAASAGAAGGGSSSSSNPSGASGGNPNAGSNDAFTVSDEMDDHDMGRLQAMLEARGFPPHLAGVLGPRMHHLILNRAMAPSATTKAQQLLQGLQATGDESRQLQAVIEMCQLLVMGNEDTLTGFPIRQVVPALIVLLKMEHNFDLMNHACRALTYMMEALPRSSSVIVDAIPTFLEKLQSIQCMDVAEQSLSALEMLSKKHNKSILHARGVVTCLNFLDFFSISAQRNALTISSNCCQNLSPEEFIHVADALSILSSRLVHEDKKSAETACLALSRLAESYKNDKAKLKDIAKAGVLANLQKILVTGGGTVSSQTFVTVMHILVVMSSHGSEVGPLLLKENIGGTIRGLLVQQNKLNAEASTSSAAAAAAAATSSAVIPIGEMELITRNPQELHEITSLIAELMPPLTADGIFAVDALLARPGAYIRDPVLWQWQDDKGNWHTYGYNDCRVIEAAHVAGEEEVTLTVNGKSFTLNLASMHEIKEDSGTARPIQRKLTSQLQTETESEEEKQKKQEHLDLTADLTQSLLPVLLEVYSNSAGPGVRHNCIQALLRMVYHSNMVILKGCIHVPLLSSQIAGMLSSGDLRIIVGALQMSELLLQKMPDEFGVHFRREGVLHQVQKLTDPDNPICLNQFNESPLCSWSTPQASSNVQMPSGRSWTVAGTSLANMFPEQLRVPKRRDNEDESATPTGANTATAPLRLSDMLKRKRVSKRSTNNSRKGRNSQDEMASTSSNSYDMPQLETPSRRSKLADRTSSLLSQLHPGRWVRSHHGEHSTHHHHHSSSTTTSTSSHHQQRKDSSTSPAVTPPPSNKSALLTNPATLAHSREKAKRWVREQATRFLESYFKESLGSRHPALTILRRLSAQVDHLARKPKDGERSLREILSILHENDISPFEVTQSGLVPALLAYLTKTTSTADPPIQDEIPRETRLRTFLHVFLGCPKSIDSETETVPDLEIAGKFQLFVQKLNACVNHLEQFPIKMYDMTTGSSGVKSAGSTLRFFKTHHLKCSLQRHPDCTSLKSWKGGLVKIDPLALVQAIERYLISRGYGHPQDKDSGGSDDDMSDEGPDDMLPSTSRDRLDGSGHRLEFMIGDNVLPYDMTVYQAVQQFGSTPMFDMTSGTGNDSGADPENRNSPGSVLMYGSPGIWARIHTIYYRPIPASGAAGMSSDTLNANMSGTTSKKGQKGHGGKGSNKSKRKAPDDLWNEGQAPGMQNPLIPFLVDKLPTSNNLDDPSLEVLCLLRTLHALNRYWGSLYEGLTRLYAPVINPAEFINSKLTAKVNRQLQDPIIIMTSNLPTWLKEVASICPFLFPFETRQLLFYVTSFDRDRALLRLLDSVPELGAADGGQERVTPDLDRKKRVISRENLLKQAEQVVNELAQSRSLLEIQYENEVGTGLGPTMEFYTLVSKELQRADLSLWKGESVKISSDDVMEAEDEDASECIDYVFAPAGLYPLPMARSTKSSHKNKLKVKFNFVGKFIAKAVLDNRMVDLPFSLPFYQWLLKEESTFTSQDLRNIDPTIASTVSQLEGIVRKKRKLEEDPKLSPSEKQLKLKNLTMDGCPVEDLGLDFTLPGYPNIELMKGGKDMTVTLDNLAQYVKLVSHWLLIEGVSGQMESVREGFESVFPLTSLQMFYPEELDQIFCGSSVQSSASLVQWDVKILGDSCKPDHGYNAESKSLKFLYEIMASYSREEQRQFLQFVTGCPRLPVGGFKALSPPLTVVKKTFDSPDVNPDDYLPSVMTCVNYLKLPDYSSKEIMREKLRIAAMEGQYCFHLS